MKLSRTHSRMLSLRGAALAHDVLMGFVAFLLALALRLGLEGVLEKPVAYLLATAAFGLLVGAVGFAVGMNRGVWRYASLPDLIAIIKTATLTIAIFTVAHFLIARLEDIPRSSLVISWAFLIILLAAPRAIYRSYRDRRDARRRAPGARAGKRVILVGAGDDSEMFIKTAGARSGTNYKILGIVDERGRRVGRFIRGVPILGSVEKLPDIVAGFERQGQRPEAVILTRDRNDYAAHASLETLIQTVRGEGLELLRLPNVFEMKDVGSALDLRPLELSDLLQRRPVELDLPKMASLIEGKTIMITGAGGSIGSELARQIAELRPRELVLVDASEYLLYSIDMDLKARLPSLASRALIANVRERRAITQIMQGCRPDLVFHAAALKHVPMVEMQPLEGLHTNALGTRNVAEAAVAAGVGAMVLVSTDKAVNPANVMGASKRLAEMFCQAMDLQAGPGGTRFVTVRFGNVLGSAGSVVPLFEKQLKAGGPLTVTHPRIERYFMTIPEACLLILQAAAHKLERAHDRGGIFVLDMGTPVKIADLARNVIRLSGLQPDVDVAIVYTGLRPGEKLFEELFDVRETLGKTDVPGILAAHPRSIERGLIVRIFDELQRMVETGDLAGALRLLTTAVAEFAPGKDVRSHFAQPLDDAEIAPPVKLQRLNEPKAEI